MAFHWYSASKAEDIVRKDINATEQGQNILCFSHLPPSSFADAELRFCGLSAIVFSAVYTLKSPCGFCRPIYHLILPVGSAQQANDGQDRYWIVIESIDKQHFWEFIEGRSEGQEEERRDRCDKSLRQINLNLPHI
eukprot:scaffold4781_cov141-Skeletonema_marinoi.AAC.5